MSTRPVPAGPAAPPRQNQRDKGKREFELSDETRAALLSAFVSEPEKLARMRQRIAEAEANEAKLRVLRARKAALLQRNRVLRDKAGLPPETEQAEQAAPTTSAPAPPTASSPVPAPEPAPPLPLSSARPVSSTQATVNEFGEKPIDTRTAPVPSDWGRRVTLYQYAGPSLKGVVSSVFEDGLLYRVITERGDWGFYNDTRYYEMRVHYLFHASSKVTAGPRCALTKTASGAWEAKMTVPPEETLLLVSGSVVDFENKSQAVLLGRHSPSASVSPSSNLYTTQLSERRAIQEALGTSAAPLNDDTDEEVAMRVCLAKRIPFVDPTFFPDHSALCANTDSFFIPPLRWSRPRDYLPTEAAKEVRLFRDSAIDSRQLVHGELLPDSGFTSAVRGLAEVPHLLRRLFRHPGDDSAVALAEHEAGGYRVHLCCGGVWRCILVDDYVPSRAHCPEFAHVRSDLRILWFPLLEKAYAKAHGTFSALLNSPVEVVTQDLCGAPTVTLDSVWPSSATAQDVAGRDATPHALGAFLEAFYQEARGKVLLKTFSLATARTQSMRERLERSYHSLGLTPGVGVVVLGVEVHGAHTLVCLRQTLVPRLSGRATTQGSHAALEEEDDEGPDWLQVWLDEKKPWAPALADAFAERVASHTVYMDVSDVPQYFQGGCAVYAVTRFAELRLTGPCLFTKGCPSHCLAIDVAAPVTLMATLTQVKLADAGSGGFGSSHSRRKGSDDGLGFSTSLGSLSAFAALEAIGLQVLGSTGEKVKTLELVQCTRGVANMFTRAARDDTVTHTFATSTSVGVALVPEMSPYFIIPRVQSTSAAAPYTLAIFLQKQDNTQVSVSAISAAPFDRVVASSKVPPGVPSPTVADIVTPARAQYRWRSTDVITSTELTTLTWQ